MAGFSGAAALDAQGQFLGMMEMRNAVLASVEAAAPPVRLIPARAIRAFLERARGARRRRDGADAKGVGGAACICVRK